jgi:hypothetical protein
MAFRSQTRPQAGELHSVLCIGHDFLMLPGLVEPDRRDVLLCMALTEFDLACQQTDGEGGVIKARVSRGGRAPHIALSSWHGCAIIAWLPGTSTCLERHSVQMALSSGAGCHPRDI